MIVVHPLPPVSRLLLSVAVLAPWTASMVVLTGGPTPFGVARERVLAVAVVAGVVAMVACLVLAVTDPALRGRRGRWVAGFVLASAITPVAYLWAWQWRRPTHSSPSVATPR